MRLWPVNAQTLPAAALFLLVPAAFAGAEGPPLVIKVHYTQRDQQVDRYVNVPFEVPPATTRLDLALAYDKAGGENVVDLGLLEPGPIALGTRAFRGWTGGERSEIFLTATDATPGYWPGPIQPGRWHVGLGLYKVGSAGVDVEVTVRLSSAALEEEAPSPSTGPSRAPVRSGPAWYSGALHAHTTHSDGALSAQELAGRARAEGLDFLAITDHNNTAHQRERIDVPGLLTIVGEEVTTPGGHFNVWGLSGARAFIDFRVPPGDPAIETLVDQAVAQGAVAGINHPFSACVACSWTHRVPQAVSTIEISGREPEEMPRAVALWDTLLRAGRRIAAVGVSDWHRGDTPLGAASVRIWARELSTPAILDGIRSGRVVVMADGVTAPPELRLRAGDREGRVGDTLDLHKGDSCLVTIAAPGSAYEGARVELFWNGEVVATLPLVNGEASITRYVSTNGYLRAHVIAPSGRPIAVTNPVWIRTSVR